MTSTGWDNFFKIASIVSGLIIIPTFAWVWQTNTKVQETEIVMRHLQDEVEKMKSNIKTNVSDVKSILVQRQSPK